MSHAAKSMVVEMGIVSSLLQALVKLKNVSFSDVSIEELVNEVWGALLWYISLL